MNHKKKLAAKLLNTSPHKVIFSVDALDDIQKAITRSDIRGLIAVKKIRKDTTNHQSRAGARWQKQQKRKGRRKGRGAHKGSKHSTVSRKEQWINKVRAQRIFLQQLRTSNLLSLKNYRLLYGKCKGGYFRNKRHIKLYIGEHNLIQPRTSP